MNVTPTALPGVLILKPDLFPDARGFFVESYHQQKYQAAGVAGVFVQDNHSKSVRHTLRGLHAQSPHAQGKLVRVIQGEIFDVIVDIRKGSPTYKKWISVILSSENFLQCYVPPDFAHGFCVLSETAEVEYKCTDFYEPGAALNLIWNDPDIGITWPTDKPLLSAKDAAGVTLAELNSRLPMFESQKFANNVKSSL